MFLRFLLDLSFICHINPQYYVANTISASNIIDNYFGIFSNDRGYATTPTTPLIVSNPPYIPSAEVIKLSPEVQFYDPLLALDGGDDGLKPYRYLAKQITLLLKPNAYAIFEFGFGQGESIREIFKQSGYLIHQMLFDLNNIERAIIIRSD